MLLYKIKRTDGKFSGGGAYPMFVEKGKEWKTIGHLKSHLRLVKDQRTIERYDNCEIVVVKMVEESSHVVNMKDLIKGMKK